MRAPAALLHPRQLTSRWLTSALGQGGVRADVRAFRWRRIGQHAGIGDFVTRVELDYRSPTPPDAPPSVVIKFRRFPSFLPMAEAERAFYRELAADCPIATPRFYAGALNRGARRWSLVIEDLRRLRPLDDVVGISADDAPVAVEALARLHAWGRRQRPRSWFWDAYAETEDLRAWYEANVERGIRRLRGFVPRADLARFRGLADHESVARALLAAEPLTPSHQDFRGDNLFMTPDHRLVAVDWGILWRYRGGAELGRFLASSLESSVLRRDGEALIRLYARTVAEGGFSEYTLPQIERDVRLGFLRLMVRSVAQLPSPVLGRGRPLRVVRTWAIRSSAAVRHVDALDAIPPDALRSAARLGDVG